MKFLNAQIKWTMLLSGLFTCSLFTALFLPAAGLEIVFGVSAIEQPFTEIVVRNWGALIGGVGVLLIYGGFKPHSRHLILVIAAVSKSIFIGLNLLIGSDYLSTSLVPIVFDSLFILLYVLYLCGSRPTSA
ncbi:MAG: hypothetical protein ACJAY7_001436 [Pseudohongiellaceae bacterium]|jgi:hypothetical protein